MTTEASKFTWQKIATVAALLALVIPVAGRLAWQVVFPPDYLLYEEGKEIAGNNTFTFPITVSNGGHAVQKEVSLRLPRQSYDAKKIFVGVDGPQRSFLINISTGDPKTPLSTFAKGDFFVIPIGAIQPEEAVIISLLAAGEKGDSPRIDRVGLRVESSTMVAIEADGLRRPDFDPETLHGNYWQVAPYILALLGAFLGLLVLFGLLFDAVFDDDRKKMTRLWRQMDLLQEKIDKERRYE